MGSESREQATFGTDCFRCVEAVLQGLEEQGFRRSVIAPKLATLGLEG